jgi:hypothetical protein
VLRTHQPRTALLGGPGGTHRVRLAGARLAVGEDGHVVALQERADALAEVLPHALLVDILAEDAVKDEQLLALGGLDRQVCGCCDLAGGAAEALRDEIVARIFGLEGRAHADGLGRSAEEKQRAGRVVPTLTAVLPSSSE